MVDRRVFMKYGAGLAAALIGAPRAAGGPAASRPAPAPDVALVDRRLEGGHSFAAKARARGRAPFEFSSDVAGVWMRELEPRLRAGPATIEGYTTGATLFCLELLARDYGARVVRRSATTDGVAWIVSSSPMQRAALAPLQSRSAAYA